MKKLFAGAAGVLLMGAGLVAAGGTTAHADPYPGTIATVTTVSAPVQVKRQKRATICADVRVKTGTGTPIGTVTITVKRNAGKFNQAVAFPYNGGQVCLKTRNLNKKGGYTATAAYNSGPNRVYDDSTGVAGFTVTKSKK